ncbi:hypothetical protein M422DRAFT_200142 [Sphaerobolus stellatus SS14]|nr:hypothetical protein M422DRAFT_200142 [Sphaerobolus stellatus SS14]
MPASEIDAIFATKGKAKLAEELPSSSKAKGKAKTESVADTSASASSSKKSKKKKKKKKAAEGDKASTKEEEAASTTATSSGSKRKLPEPETILDPSLSLSQPSKRQKKPLKSIATVEPSSKKKTTAADPEDEGRFRDSRGSGPKRKTEEGYSIYKEDELGIRDEGGDTPLCPFDCDCCF